MSPEQLRRAAMEALGEHADERARDVLRRATITVSGPFTSIRAFDGVRVTLGLDAGTLGTLRAAPAVVDALTAALAAGVRATSTPGRSLLDLELRWLRAAPATTAAYRDAPPAAHEMAFHEALLAYLAAAGDHALASSLTAAGESTDDGREVVVRLPRGEADALRADAYGMARLTAAVRDLLARNDARVRVCARD